MFNTKTKEILDLIDENSFIVADTHFGHKKVLEFEPGRLEQMKKDGVESHEEWLIKNWNEEVGEKDIVLHLGDYAFKGIPEITKRLNGFKILILGNHDRKGEAVYKDFDYVIRGLNVEEGKNLSYYSHSEMTDLLTSILIKKINGKKVMFSHYPVCESELRFYEKRKSPLCDRLIVGKELYYEHDCEINFHGHTHSINMVDRDSRVFKNCSIDNIGYKPVRISELL